MTNNDLLRRLRYALNLDGKTMAEIFGQAGYEIGPADALKFLKKDDEPGFVVCDDTVMGFFLDGLIIHKRGRDQQSFQPAPLTNNLILRKLRIALELTDEDMLGLLKQADVNISKSQVISHVSQRRAPKFQGMRETNSCGNFIQRPYLGLPDIASSATGEALNGDK